MPIIALISALGLGVESIFIIMDTEKIKNRFEEYSTKTAPLRAYYQGQNKFYQIDGVGDITAITQRLITCIQGLL